MKPQFLIISEMAQLRVERNCWFTGFISLPSTTSGRNFRFGPLEGNTPAGLRFPDGLHVESNRSQSLGCLPWT